MSVTVKRNVREASGNLVQAVRRWVIGGALLLVCCGGAVAHNGPPFPIITDQRVGPCVISLWTHPDLGTGAFWIMVDPPAGGSVPADLNIQIGVAPVSGRLPEAMYWAWREKQKGQVQFKSEAQFDQDEMWKVRVVLHSAGGTWEAASQVEATPAGFGRWDLLLFALPFAGAGILWFGLIAKKMGYRKRNQPVSVKASSQS
jgi:hypothetical protein